MAKQKINPASEEGRLQTALSSVRSSLSNEEIERIRQSREFDEIKPDTITWDIALFNDQLRNQKRENMSLVERRVNNCLKLKNGINRLKIQFATGTITEKLSDGITANADEVKWMIAEHTQTLRSEVWAIPKELANLRSVVGHMTIDKQVVMTQEAFDHYAESIKLKVKEIGYSLFDE